MYQVKLPHHEIDTRSAERKIFDEIIDNVVFANHNYQLVHLRFASCQLPSHINTSEGISNALKLRLKNKAIGCSPVVLFQSELQDDQTTVWFVCDQNYGNDFGDTYCYVIPKENPSCLSGIEYVFQCLN